MIAVLGLLATLAFVFAVAALADDRYPNCRGWINHTCCCTSGSCLEVQPGELEQLTEDTYRVVLTGEIAKRTGWSQDGTFIRCAATFDPETAKWLIGPQYNTRCLFVPMPAS